MTTSTTTTPRLITTVESLRSEIAAARSAGHKLGLVPTMGALHAGHLSLVEAAKSECDVTFVTIFVNPTQFGPGEDLQEYPRTLPADMEALGKQGVDFVFTPTNEIMYPDGFSTNVEPPDVAKPLEGRCRPGHFRGVATVVLKLFNLIPADTAYFGQKDYQQSLVIRRMVEDLNLPMTIRVCPIVRESDGLALSSRNAYLSDDQRQHALALSSSLNVAAELIGEGERDAAAVTAQMRQVFAAAGINRVDYIAVADTETLEEVRKIDREVVVAVAAHVGDTRLIDNRVIK